jgi:ketosteroid isomerase-like protein
LKRCACALIAAASATAVAAPPEPWAALEATWNRAHLEGDVERLRELWADDIRIVVPGMTPMAEQEAVAMWRNVPVRFTDYRSSELEVDEHGDVAVVTGLIDRTRQFGERQAAERWRFLKVYVRQGDSWRVRHFVATPAADP